MTTPPAPDPATHAAASPATPSAASEVATPDPGVTAARYRLAGVALALAALFHLLGNPVLARIDPPSLVLVAVELLLGALAVVVLVGADRDGARGPWWLAALCALTVVSVGAEAPFLGNHWLLAGFLAAAIGVGAVRRPTSGAAARDGLAAARWVLLVAYGFAALAKYNTGFLDPIASCAVVYGDQWLAGLGVGAGSIAGTPLATAAIVGTIAVETAIPLLLAVPRTRRLGVLVGLAFHGLVALDLGQHFYDFSAVLYLGFLLFLPDDDVAAVLGRLRRVARPLGLSATSRWVTRGAVATVLGLVALLSVVTPVGPVLDLLRHLGHVAWAAWALALLAAVVPVAAAAGWVARDGGRSLRLSHGAWLLLPLLVVANGLMPYLQVRTAYGFNMYANLRIVDDASNHLFLPALDLTGSQDRLATIVSSSDPSLQHLADEGMALPLPALGDYLAGHPETSVVLELDGERATVERAGDEPTLSTARHPLVRRLAHLRAVDPAPGPPRCQTLWTAAR